MRRWKPQTSARQRVLHLLNFSFLLLTFRPGIHQQAEIRNDQKEEKFKDGGHRAAIIEGKNYELIHRSESGDCGGDELRRVDRGRHGPGVTIAASAA